MTHLKHTCGQQIGYRIASSGRHSDAYFYSLDAHRQITRCPECAVYLYPALVAGDLRDVDTGKPAE